MLRYLLILITLFILSACSNEDVEHHSEEKEHAEHSDNFGKKSESAGHEEHEEETGVIHLKPEQMKMANIVVETLQLTKAEKTIMAPAEVKLNDYRTTKATPRINAQIIKRHAKLGDEVSKDQALVTLSSVEMAEAQGQLLLADKEWKRVKKLGRKIVSERQYVTAKIEYQKSYASAKAFGMNEPDIKKLLAQKRSADGSFQLIASQAGRVLHDKFIVGEYVEAGHELMVVSDESIMWVEAHLSPETIRQIDIGNSAEVLLDDQRLAAKVIQLHHTLDETTRTSAVRLEVSNEKDQLHGGQFVTAIITVRNKDQALQVPEAAVLRSSDGDWTVMVEQDEVGEFKSVEIEVKSISDGKAIIEGIKPGRRIVTQGAFFIQSELAKGGFEIHNH